MGNKTNIGPANFRRYMLPFLFTYLLLCAACKGGDKRSHHPEVKYSGTQIRLLKLLDDYKTRYFSESNPQLKALVQSEYLNFMQHFIADTLNGLIDSMTVVVDSVVRDGWKVTTQFHTADIEFKYGMVFSDSMPPSADSLYNFMVNLPPGKMVTLNFFDMGAGELNFPDDRSKRTMRIFALPGPL